MQHRSRVDTGGVAVVGRSDAIAPFRAAGLRTVDCQAGPDAAVRVQELIAAGCQTVFFTSDLAPFLGAVIEKYRKAALPCLISLPLAGSRSGQARLSELVKRAVGADIFGAGRRMNGA